MKPLSAALSLSLLTNAGLAVLFFIVRPGSPETGDNLPIGSSRTSSSASEATTSSNAGIPTTDRSAADPRIPRLWTKLYTTDIDQLIVRLKSSGFTYEQIRTIVSEVGGEKFETAEAELFAQLPKVPYWKSTDGSRGPDFYAKYSRISQDRSTFYRKYFSGPEWLAEDKDAAEFARERYGPLSLEKLQAISRIQNDYSDLASKLTTERLARANTRLSVEDRQKQRLLETEREHDLQQVLTPEEFAEYQFRESPTARRLREQLELLRPSETEYKTLFALQRSVDQQFDIWSPDQEGQKAYQDALKKIAPQIETALGPDRYADYKQLTDSPNDQVVVLMSRLDLPLATAGKINALRDSANNQAKSIRNDSTLSPPDRDARLATLARESETQLGTLLRTPRGYEAYTELKGDWLRALQPKPATSSP